jgi:ER membrane protein complex subunit 8/9
MAYVLSTKSYAKIILHGAKYPTEAVAGILLGSKKDRKIVDSVPLVHSLLLPTPLVQIAIEQVELYSKSQGLDILGLYFGNEANVNILVHPATELIGNQIEERLGGGSVMIRVDSI